MNLLFYGWSTSTSTANHCTASAMSPPSTARSERVAVVEKLDVERSADESVSLHPIENDPPDLVLSASEVGSREREFLDVSE